VGSALPVQVRRSRLVVVVAAHDLPQDLAQVGSGAGFGGKPGESGEFLHVGLQCSSDRVIVRTSGLDLRD
jgi:hypothetical protein